MKRLRILCVQGECERQKSFAFDSRAGHIVRSATNVNEALTLVAQEDFEVVLLGPAGPRSPLPLFLKVLRDRSPEADVVVKTTVAEIGNGRRVARSGDFGFLQPHSLPTALLDELHRASEGPASSADKIYVIQESHSMLLGDMLLGSSAASLRLALELDMAASCDAICMLQGETGTGKDLAARYIHQTGARADQPFVIVNLPAIPKDLIESTLFGHERGAFTGAVASQEGKFELANGGTIFLDEIGDLALEQQVKLLRVIEDGEFERVGSNRRIKGDARIVAATSRRLDEMLADGRFRRDLYYRLVVMPIHVPPLRDRPDDIHALSLFFLDRYARKYHKGLVGFTPDVYGIFAKQPWHGNVRELSHTIERMAIYASAKKEFLDIPDLPMDFLIASAETERKSGLAGDKEEFEKRLILDALRNNDYNSSRAARALRLPVETLRYRIKKYGINKDRPDST